MSRKSHPIGYKLGISYLWELTCNLNNYRNTLLRNYFLLNWLLKFCTQNFFYFFNFQYFYETRVVVIYSFVFYFNFFLTKQRLRYRKTLFLLSTKFKYRNPRYKHPKRALLLTRFKYRFYFLYLNIIKSKLKLLRRFHAYNKKRKKKILKKGVSRKYANLFSVSVQNNIFLVKKLLFKKYFINSLSLLRLKAKVKKKKKKKLRFKERFTKYKKKYKKTFKKKSQYKAFDKWSKKRHFDVSFDTPDDLIYASLPVAKEKIKKKKFKFLKTILKIIQYKFFILRFKYFLEKHLAIYLTKQCVLLLCNVGNISFYKKLKKLKKQKFKTSFLKKKLNLFDKTFLTVYNDTYEFKYFKSLVTYVSLFVYATLYVNPRVLIQWFVYQIIRIKKHSLNTSHNKLIKLFTTMLKNAIFLSALLIGYRFEVIGKVNGSLRTKKVLNFYGFPVKRQSFQSVYEFYNTDVRTYTGSLSLKLWLIK